MSDPLFPELKLPENVEQPTETITITTKPRGTVVLEGTLYVLISAIPPAVTVLQGTEPLTPRTVTALIFSCVVAGAIALKAFLSQSMSATKPHS